MIPDPFESRDKYVQQCINGGVEHLQHILQNSNVALRVEINLDLSTNDTVWICKQNIDNNCCRT